MSVPITGAVLLLASILESLILGNSHICCVLAHSLMLIDARGSLPGLLLFTIYYLLFTLYDYCYCYCYYYYSYCRVLGLWVIWSSGGLLLREDSPIKPREAIKGSCLTPTLNSVLQPPRDFRSSTFFIGAKQGSQKSLQFSRWLGKLRLWVEGLGFGNPRSKILHPRA